MKRYDDENTVSERSIVLHFSDFLFACQITRACHFLEVGQIWSMIDFLTYALHLPENKLSACLEMGSNSTISVERSLHLTFQA